MSCKTKKMVKVAKAEEKDEDGANYHGIDLEQEKGKLNKPFEGVSSSKFPPAEEMLKRNEEEFEKMVEQVKQAQLPKITKDNYCFRFGKYTGMLAKDVAGLSKINQKTGKAEPVGKKYIMFLINEPWLNAFDKQILTEIITM